MRGFDLKLDEHQENVFISFSGNFIFPNYEIFSDYPTRPCVYTKMVILDESETMSYEIFVTDNGINGLIASGGVFMYALV